MPGRSASLQEDLSAATSAAAQPPPARPPPRRAATAGGTSPVLFALRRADSDASGGGDGGGGTSLKPRLAPWPAAKALLESLRPGFDRHQVLTLFTVLEALCNHIDGCMTGASGS